MAYTRPVGEVNLDLTGTSYTRPVGEVNLDLGAIAAPARTVVVAGETLAPTGALSIQSGRVLAGAGETLAPTGAGIIAFTIPIRVAGETLGPTGGIVADYDPNLLSDVVCSGQGSWRIGQTTLNGVQSDLRAAPPLAISQPAPWRTAAFLPVSGLLEGWMPSARNLMAQTERWRTAAALRNATDEAWRQAERLATSSRAGHREAEPLRTGITLHYRLRLSLFTRQSGDAFREGAPISNGIRQEIQQQGILTLNRWIVRWREASYSFHGLNDGPPVPRRRKYPPPVGWVELNLQCRRSTGSRVGVVDLDLQPI